MTLTNCNEWHRPAGGANPFIETGEGVNQTKPARSGKVLNE